MYRRSRGWAGQRGAGYGSEWAKVEESDGWVRPDEVSSGTSSEVGGAYAYEDQIWEVGRWQMADGRWKLGMSTEGSIGHWASSKW